MNKPVKWTLLIGIGVFIAIVGFFGSAVVMSIIKGKAEAREENKESAVEEEAIEEPLKKKEEVKTVENDW